MKLFFALLLTVIANSAPILVNQLPWFNRFDFPVDFHKRFIDHRPWLGKSKTWRGVISAIIMTAVCAYWLNLGWFTGMMVGMLAMTGDSLSSFFKRRLGLASGAMAPGIDQIPESLLPLLYLQMVWHYQGWQTLALVVSFIVVELTVSRLLFRWHIRKHPY